jgi:hypothetical protein
VIIEDVLLGKVIDEKTRRVGAKACDQRGDVQSQAQACFAGEARRLSEGRRIYNTHYYISNRANFLLSNNTTECNCLSTS